MAALRYAELGYPVFPCAPGRKTPLTKRGNRDATTDAAQIEQWWLQRPNANIGIATHGLVVIDVDAGSIWLVDEPDRSADLEAAPLSQTANGGRQHIFRQPHERLWRNTAGRLAEKVDTRADGGYIVVPPSMLSGGRVYRWADGLKLDVPPAELSEPPQWLIEQLDELATPRSKAKPARATSPRTSSPTAARVASGSPGANAIPSGQRNATLAKLAGTMRRAGMSRSEILAALERANAERCSPPLDAPEVERIADSVGRYQPDQITVALIENHWAQMYAPPRADGPPDPGPFPDRLLSVPGFVGDLAAFMVATAFRPQPVLALGAAIALMGTLTGRKVCDETNTRTNVYCLGVCPSGGGKERARQVNKEILFLAGAPEMAGPEGLASHAGLITAVEQQPAILFQLDEIGRLLRTLVEPGRSPHLYHIATNMMKLFTSSATVYVGDAYADARRNKVIHQPHACVYGTTVPQSLYEGLTAENVTDGFLSRVMIFESSSDRAPRQRPVIQSVPDDLVDFAHWWIEYQPGGNLAAENPSPTTITVSPSASAAFDALDDHAEQTQLELGDPLGTLWTRATEKARKLALIRSCSRARESPEINEADAVWACDLSRYLTERLVYLASQWVAENPFDAKRKRVLRLISDAGEVGVTRSELYSRTRAFTTRERSEVLETLLLCGDVVEQKEQTGGAPRVRYVAATHAGEASS